MAINERLSMAYRNVLFEQGLDFKGENGFVFNRDKPKSDKPIAILSVRVKADLSDS